MGARRCCCRIFTDGWHCRLCHDHNGEPLPEGEPVSDRLSIAERAAEATERQAAEPRQPTTITGKSLAAWLRWARESGLAGIPLPKLILDIEDEARAEAAAPAARPDALSAVHTSDGPKAHSAHIGPARPGAVEPISARAAMVARLDAVARKSPDYTVGGVPAAVWADDIDAIEAEARMEGSQEAGHATADPHDCFLMNCHSLGSEVIALRDALAEAVSSRVAALEAALLAFFRLNRLYAGGKATFDADAIDACFDTANRLLAVDAALPASSRSDKQSAATSEAIATQPEPPLTVEDILGCTEQRDHFHEIRGSTVSGPLDRHSPAAMSGPFLLRFIGGPIDGSTWQTPHADFDWPLPDVLTEHATGTFPGGRYRKARESQLTEDVPGVIRGAEYEWVAAETSDGSEP